LKVSWTPAVRPSKHPSGKSVCQGKDSQGRAVPDAVVKVNFQVAGAGDLIGVGNGNPHNVDSFSRPRHYTWHGQALAILRPAKWPGGLMGLREGSCDKPS
jgi:beta-galactosidase